VAPHPKRVVTVERVEDIIFSMQISPDFRAILERCAIPQLSALGDSKKLLQLPAGSKKRRHLDVAVDETVLTAPEKAELTTLKAADKKVVEHIKLFRTSYLEADQEAEALRKEIELLQATLERKTTTSASVHGSSVQTVKVEPAEGNSADNNRRQEHQA
jgi:hypothetical protein